jgi:hypothetical protein
MIQSLRDALLLLSDKCANGDETMIKANANYPITIWSEIDNIDQECDLNLDYAVTSEGIYKLDCNGYLEQVPVYRVI